MDDPLETALSPELFARAFPFHFVLDRRLLVVQAGHSLGKVLPGLCIGDYFGQLFSIDRPSIPLMFDAIAEREDSLFLLVAESQPDLRLKGEFLFDRKHHCLIFVGSPWLSRTTDLPSIGLKLNDFAHHDSVADFLFLLKSNQAALEDGKELTDKLSQEKELVQVTLESIADGVITTDVQERVRYINPAARKMIGDGAERAVGNTIDSLLQFGDEFTSRPISLPECRDRLVCPLPANAALLAADGCHLAVAGRVSPILDKQGAYLGRVLVFRDVSSQRRMIRQMEYHATHDLLTSLPNRMLITDRLHQGILEAARNGEKLAVLFLDLDRFKNVNDSGDHGLGDRLLIQVARRLQACIRSADTVGRHGGDEFIVLVPHLHDVAVIDSHCRKLIDALNQPFYIDGYSFDIGACIGVAIYPDNGEDAAALIKLADMSMYQAKTKGRNCYLRYQPAFNKRTQERLVLEKRLRAALVDGHLQLHYQPKAALADGRYTGCEALLRWIDPQGEGLGPAEFIPLAEETGLIYTIGEWVIAEACRQGAEWHRQGIEVPIAVNVSGLQLLREDFAHQVDRALNEFGLPPHLLEAEITETVMMEALAGIEASLVERNIAALKSLGIKISMDDFGTGYSSLGHLKRLPVDTLKIDRSFVRDIVDDHDDLVLVRAIIDLSHNLGKQVIAEGVENLEQLALLRQLNCDQIQGYLLARPQPPVAVAQVLQHPALLLTAPLCDPPGNAEQ